MRLAQEVLLCQIDSCLLQVRAEERGKLWSRRLLMFLHGLIYELDSRSFPTLGPWLQPSVRIHGSCRQRSFSRSVGALARNTGNHPPANVDSGVSVGPRNLSIYNPSRCKLLVASAVRAKSVEPGGALVAAFPQNDPTPSGSCDPPRSRNKAKGAQNGRADPGMSYPISLAANQQVHLFQKAWHDKTRPGVCRLLVESTRTRHHALPFESTHPEPPSLSAPS